MTSLSDDEILGLQMGARASITFFYKTISLRSLRSFRITMYDT